MSNDLARCVNCRTLTNELEGGLCLSCRPTSDQPLTPSVLGMTAESFASSALDRYTALHPSLTQNEAIAMARQELTALVGRRMGPSEGCKLEIAIVGEWNKRGLPSASTWGQVQRVHGLSRQLVDEGNRSVRR